MSAFDVFGVDCRQLQARTRTGHRHVRTVISQALCFRLQQYVRPTHTVGASHRWPQIPLCMLEGELDRHTITAAAPT
jgi:hypothetical protein